MSEWWTYTLSDIAMFSRQAYYRLYELHNAAIWPAHVVAFAAGLLVWRLSRSAEAARGRLVAGVLAACWILVAVGFHAARYATIHWAGVYFAMLFGLEAALLVWTGVLRGRLVFAGSEGVVARAGTGIFAFALLLQPIAGLAFGRGWRQIEIFGVAPDPTAVATLGVLLTASGRVRWELAAVPVIWCVISGATLVAIEAPDAAIMLAATTLGLSLAVVRTLAGRRRTSPRRADPSKA